MTRYLAAAITLVCISTTAQADWTTPRTDELGTFRAKYVNGQMVVWQRNAKCYGVPSKKPIPCEDVPTIAEAPVNHPAKPGLVIARVSLAPIVKPLRNYIEALAAKCGTVTVISGYRNSRTPNGSVSCHARRKAVDVQIADRQCALNFAKGKAIGHSVDYCGAFNRFAGIACHFHISHGCGREMGARFVHRGYGEPNSRRYAKRYSKKRYAKRWRGYKRYAQYRR